MRIIDLRSDTKTLPTEEMLDAIKHAKFGDEQAGEDPTVNKLQDLAAKKLGKESALLVTSGTQGNLVSLLSQTKPGDEVILGMTCHTYNHEAGGLTRIAGLIPRPLTEIYGALNPEDIEKVIMKKTEHTAGTSIVCIENTHNTAGGTIVTPSQIDAIAEVTHRHGLKLHCDGARIFNAAVAMNMDVKNFTKKLDSISFSLSKGLSCPVGAVICGSEEFIKEAWNWKQILGGGMRQAGVIAAPGIVALEKMIDRLKEDNANARLLGEGLAKIDGISIDLKTVQTNIVRFNLGSLGISEEEFVDGLAKHGILCGGHAGAIRMVTHRHITRDDVKYGLETIKKEFKR
jgi:threonine aldolase